MRPIQLTHVYQLLDTNEELTSLLSSHDYIAIITGKKAYEKSWLFLESTFKKKEYSLTIYGNECTFENVERLVKNDDIKIASLIIGLGGGKAIDTAKCVAHYLQVPIITIPSIASTCAATSAISVVYTTDHHFVEVFQLSQPPIACFMPMQTLIEAPVAFLWAGIGDTLAKPVEVEFNLRGKNLSVSQQLALTQSSLCLDLCLKHGESALTDAKNKIISEAFVQTTFAILVNTGFVSSLLDSRFGGSLAHAISNALTKHSIIEEKHKHGEVVAYGLLVLLHLDQQFELLNQLVAFYKAIHLPLSLSQLELSVNETLLNDMWLQVKDSVELSEAAYSINEIQFMKSILTLEGLS